MGIWITGYLTARMTQKQVHSEEHTPTWVMTPLVNRSGSMYPPLGRWTQGLLSQHLIFVCLLVCLVGSIVLKALVNLAPLLK